MCISGGHFEQIKIDWLIDWLMLCLQLGRWPRARQAVIPAAYCRVYKWRRLFRSTIFVTDSSRRNWFRRSATMPCGREGDPRVSWVLEVDHLGRVERRAEEVLGERVEDVDAVDSIAVADGNVQRDQPEPVGQRRYDTIRDTIRDASLIYSTEQQQTGENRKSERLKSKNGYAQKYW